MKALSGVLVAAVFAAGASFGDVWYVDVNAPAGGDGRSWTQAFKGIQPAIDAATADGGEVWVAEGVYAGTRESESGGIVMRSGVDVYGGFRGDERSRDARVWREHETVIDGFASRRGQRAFHVVIGADDSLLDGFVVRGGAAGEFSSIAAAGGGMLNIKVSPVVRNCTFELNDGSAVFNLYSAPEFINCIFRNNTGLRGGAMQNESAATKIETALFEGNLALTQQGGALFNFRSQIKVNGAEFVANMASDGGAVYESESTGVFTYVQFSQNEASPGLGRDLFVDELSYSEYLGSGSPEATNGQADSVRGAWVAARVSESLVPVSDGQSMVAQRRAPDDSGVDRNEPQEADLISVDWPPIVEGGAIHQFLPVLLLSQFAQTARGYLPDPPTVQAIFALDPSPTESSLVQFAVIFNTYVTGVDASDFTVESGYYDLQAFGVASAYYVGGPLGSTITAVEAASSYYMSVEARVLDGMGANALTVSRGTIGIYDYQWNVTVDVATGFGRLSIDLIDNDSIMDSEGVPLGTAGAGNGTYTSGDSYWILGDPIWVDFGESFAGAGVQADPFREFRSADFFVSDGGTVKIKGDVATTESDETGTFSKALTIEAVGGPVRIGVTGARSVPKSVTGFISGPTTRN